MSEFQIKDYVQLVITIGALAVGYGRLMQTVKNLDKRIDEMKSNYQKEFENVNRVLTTWIGITNTLNSSVNHLQGYLEAKKNGVKIKD